MTYTTTFYNEEFDLIARAEIRDVWDLANQRVSDHVGGAGTPIPRLFNLVGITVTPVNEDSERALEKLRSGRVTEERLMLAELLEKVGEGDFLRAVAEAVLHC